MSHEQESATEGKMSEGLLMKYFVLKPKGFDNHAIASRRAMRAYANWMISHGQEEFGLELRAWADKECEDAQQHQTLARSIEEKEL